MSNVTLDPNSRRAVQLIENLATATRAGVRYGAWQAGNILKRNTRADILRKPKSGKTYVTRNRAGARRRHVASAPGETHANQSGALRRSLGFEVRGKELEFGYYNAPDYAPFVEEGTRKMAPRPSLRNNIQRSERDITNAIEHGIRERLK